MSAVVSNLGENTRVTTAFEHSPKCSWPAANFAKMIISELKIQRGIVLPLVVMNFTWFIKIAITTAFLGRLGELTLAGATVGFTFANVTGLSVLNGLSAAMEPICGQAYGAKNFRLLHKTLLMTIALLLPVSVPISFLWLNVDKILIYFGQEQDISRVAKTYVLYLLPDLVVTSFLCPLKSYLSSQSITLPNMFSSALALACHIPINILLSKEKGLVGVSMAVWITDLIAVILLATYVSIVEIGKQSRLKEGGWLTQGYQDWIKLLKLAGPCCLTTCLEWWCYEVLVLLTGRLANATLAVGVLAIVLNFDYLIYSVMISLATCASIRVSNELGANHPDIAYQSTCVTLSMSVICGGIGSSVMLAARGSWGSLFSHNKDVIRGVKKILLLMSLVEVVNFPLIVCGGIVRGTARPWLTMHANIGGFYLLALPLGVILAFKVALGLAGLLIGFLFGAVACLVLLTVFVVRINWDEEVGKAQILASDVCHTHVLELAEGHQKTGEAVSTPCRNMS